MIIIVNVENLILMFWGNISQNTEETVIWREETWNSFWKLREHESKY